MSFVRFSFSLRCVGCIHLHAGIRRCAGAWCHGVDRVHDVTSGEVEVSETEVMVDGRQLSFRDAVVRVIVGYYGLFLFLFLASSPPTKY